MFEKCERRPCEWAGFHGGARPLLIGASSERLFNPLYDAEISNIRRDA